MRLLFVTANRLGDAVLSTGIFNYLLAHHVNAKICVVCGPIPAPLFAAAPGDIHVITAEKKSWKRHWFTLWRQCISARWDIVIDLRSSGLAYLLWAKKRIIASAPTAKLHRVEWLASLLDLDHPPSPQLWVRADDEMFALQHIPRYHSCDRVLALGPGANWSGKIWRPAYFAELAKRLTSPEGILPGARIAILASAEERAIADQVIERLGGCVILDLVGVSHVAHIHACLRRCSFFIGNDSGLMHLAAAAGVPTLGLFGPSDEKAYGPWGKHVMTCRTPTSYHEFRRQQDFGAHGVATLMDGITVTMVERAAIALKQKIHQPV